MWWLKRILQKMIMKHGKNDEKNVQGIAEQEGWRRGVKFETERTWEVEREVEKSYLFTTQNAKAEKGWKVFQKGGQRRMIRKPSGAVWRGPGGKNELERQHKANTRRNKTKWNETKRDEGKRERLAQLEAALSGAGKPKNAIRKRTQ